MLMLFGGPASVHDPAGTSDRNAPPRAPEIARATVSLDTDGNVRSATVSFTTSASKLHLGVPERSGLLAEFDPEVDDVTVWVDDQPIRVVGPMEPGDYRTVPLPEGTSDVRLDYTSTGTFRRTPSPVAGRGLTLLTPLVITESEEAGTSIRLVDGRVLNVGCVVDQEMKTCGEGHGLAWVIDVGPGQTDAVAQVDLGQTP